MLFSLSVIFIMRSGFMNRLSGAPREGQSCRDGNPARCKRSGGSDTERRNEMLIAAGYGSGHPCPCRGRCVLWVFLLSAKSISSSEDHSYPGSRHRSGSSCFPTKSMREKKKKKKPSPRETLPPIISAWREATREQGRARPAPSAPKSCLFPARLPVLHFSSFPRRSPHGAVGWSRSAPVCPHHADPLPAGTAPDHPCFSHHRQAGLSCPKDTVSPHHANPFFYHQCHIPLCRRRYAAALKLGTSTSCPLHRERNRSK